MENEGSNTKYDINGIFGWLKLKIVSVFKINRENFFISMEILIYIIIKILV